MTNIEELRHVIRQLHGAESTHRESVPVKEVWEGRTVWDGVVEVFHLHDHPETKTVYAWSHDTDDPENPKRHVTVLHIHPALTPLDAVRSSLMRDYYATQA